MKHSAVWILLCAGLSAGLLGAERPVLTNPVRPAGADPWLIRTDGSYYFSEGNGKTDVYVHRFGRLSDIRTSVPFKAYDAVRAPVPLNSLWGPHLTRIRGQWYIYFCAQQNRDPSFGSQRMWVIRSKTDSYRGPYEFCGEVLDSGNRDWAIDGTVLERGDGSLYFVWSGIRREDLANGSLKQSLYIAKMLSPTRIDRRTITRLSEATHPWECSVRPIQEGPRPLCVDSNGKTILMYSANASWTDAYCLGSLTHTGGDFLDPKNWKKSAVPCFSKTDAVFGPGGASYVTSPDGKESWIIYHAARRQGSGWDRNIRMQTFVREADGTPRFGRPLPPGRPLPTPSGE